MAASSAQLDDSFSDLSAFLSPGLAAVVAAPGAALGLWIVPVMPSLLASAGLAGSGALAMSTFFGAFIIARMAAASFSATLRRRSRSAWRCLSSASMVEALMTRSAGFGGFGHRLGCCRRRSHRRLPPCRPSSSGRGRSGGGFGGGGLLARTRVGGLALGAFLFLAQAAAFGQLFFLLADGFGLGLGLGLAALQFRLLGGFGCGGRSRFVHARRDIVALDEDALLAHLDLDGARLAAGIGLLDLAGRLAHQRDLLALGAAGAVRAAQEFEQALLVGFGQRLAGRRLGNPGRLQLLKQCGRGAVQLRG